VHPLSKELRVWDALPTSETLEEKDILRVEPDGHWFACRTGDPKDLRPLQFSRYVSLGFSGYCPIPCYRFLPQPLNDLI